MRRRPGSARNGAALVVSASTPPESAVVYCPIARNPLSTQPAGRRHASSVNATTLPRALRTNAFAASASNVSTRWRRIRGASVSASAGRNPASGGQATITSMSSRVGLAVEIADQARAVRAVSRLSTTTVTVGSLVMSEPRAASARPTVSGTRVDTIVSRSVGNNALAECASRAETH